MSYLENSINQIITFEFMLQSCISYHKNRLYAQSFDLVHYIPTLDIEPKLYFKISENIYTPATNILKLFFSYIYPFLLSNHVHFKYPFLYCFDISAKWLLCKSI